LTVRTPARNIRWSITTAILLVYCLGNPASHLSALGAPTEPVIKGFYPIGDYVLEIDGAVVPEAKFYLAEQVPALLIRAGEGSANALLRPGDGSVEFIPPEAVATQSNGHLDVRVGSSPDKAKFQIFASWIVFPVENKEWTLKEKPWLLAVQSVESMLAHNPEYVWRSEAYSPNAKIIEDLKAESKNVQVRVFFGSWCAHCKRHVPHMLKVSTQLEGSNIHIDYYGLPRGWSTHPVAGPLKVTAVPTAIVSVDGKEIGRITGNQWLTPEVAIQQILQQEASSPQP
jgi:thiol-disulfide isomerase/thioredoxin